MRSPLEIDPDRGWESNCSPGPVHPLRCAGDTGTVAEQTAFISSSCHEFRFHQRSPLCGTMQFVIVSRLKAINFD